LGLGEMGLGEMGGHPSIVPRTLYRGFAPGPHWE